MPISQEEIEKAAIKRIFSEEIDLMAEHALKGHMTLAIPQFHREIYELLRSNEKRLAIAAPRGFSKSTVVSLVYVLWKVLTGQSKFVVIVSDTYAQSKNFLDAIKRELESNETILYAFGNQKNENKWAEGEIELLCGAKIIAKGQGMQMRGLKFINQRPDLIILDDLENNESVESPERRDKLERWFNAEVEPSLDPEGQIIYVGTIIHEDSLLNKILEHYEGWKKKVYKAVNEGKSLWEERFPFEKLMLMKEEYAKRGMLDLYYSEYMNEPMNEELREFKRGWFKYYRDDQLPGNLRIFFTVDPAISEKTSADESCIMVVGVGTDNRKYIIDYYHDRVNPSVLIDKIFELAELYEPVNIGIETIAYQDALSHFFKVKMKETGKFWKIEPIRTRADKEIKIRGLIAHYQEGMIYHRVGHSASLEEQLLHFPKGAHDDIADALAMQQQLWNPPMRKIVQQYAKQGKTIMELLKEDGLGASQRF